MYSDQTQAYAVTVTLASTCFLTCLLLGRMYVV